MKKNLMFLVVYGLILSVLAGEWVFGSAVLCQEADQEFVKAEMEWRAQRDRRMREPTSWLTIAGLFWLEEGENSFGTSSSNKIVLPQGSAPSDAGKFVFTEGKVEVIANEGTILKVNGQEVKDMVIKGDDAGKPDVVELGDLRMWVIKRGNRYAIRLRDLNAAPFKNYKGLEFFPPKKEYKIVADFIPYSPAKKISVATIIGTVEEMESPGYVKFRFKGKEYTLDAFSGNKDNTMLFFVFSDETSGEETYGGGRFMVSAVLEGGKVDLNFNRAYNPPCAYTPYATCPLPPKQNRLKFRVEAGEKKYPYSGIH